MDDVDDLNDKKLLNSGYRVAMRRAERRARNVRRFITFLFAALLVMGVGWVTFGGSVSPLAKITGSVYRSMADVSSTIAKGVGSWFDRSSSKDTKSAGQAAKDKTKQKIGESPAIVIVGIDEKSGKREAKGVLAVRFDTKEARIDGLAIPGNTFVSVPGRGQEEMSIAYNAGRETLLGAVGSIVPIKFEGVVEVKYADYERMLNYDLRTGLDRGKAVGIDASKVKELGKFSAGIKKSEINLIPLPVKSITIGDGVFYQPDDQGVANILKIVWGINQKAEKKIRVIVLNGNGTPGVGAKAAKALGEAGFIIVETKNAENFDYQETKILIYGDGKDAEKIRKTLGMGVLTQQLISTSVADYGVVLGADYQL